MSKPLVGETCSVRRHTSEYRIVIVRREAGRWWHSWDWAIEEYGAASGWKLRKSGTALTRAGARRLALRAYRFAVSYLSLTREEMHIAAAWIYTPKQPEESPLPAELIGGAA